MADKTDSERLTALETEVRALGELLEVKLEAMREALERPRGIHWPAVSVAIGVAGMICAGSLAWLKTNLQPIEMRISALEKQDTTTTEKIASVRAECVREHTWNWDGHKQRIDTINKNDERQEQLIRLLLGERIENEKRIPAR